MGEEGFKPIVIGLILVGLFAIAILNAGILISEQNGFAGSIADDSSIAGYKETVIGNLTDVSSSTSASDSVLSNSTITTTTSTPFVDSISGIWKSVRVIPVAIWNTTFGLVAQKLLGGDSVIVLSVIGAILGLIIIFAVIRFIATGDSR